jgi:hypothetical protein
MTRAAPELRAKIADFTRPLQIERDVVPATAQSRIAAKSRRGAAIV